MFRSFDPADSFTAASANGLNQYRKVTDTTQQLLRGLYMHVGNDSIMDVLEPF
jgi:hypothetical protein